MHRDAISPKKRSAITESTQIASGIFDFSLAFDLCKAKENGITMEEIASIMTYLLF
jgi:hypothetical protein